MRLLSYENFRQIWDEQTKKGRDLTVFFPNLRAIDKEISKFNTTVKQLSEIDSATSSKNFRKEKLKTLREAREACLQLELENLAKKIDYQFREEEIEILITDGAVVQGDSKAKRTYRLGKNSPDGAVSFFASKAVQADITRAFNIKIPGRRSQTRQFYGLLSDKMPIYVLKTDIISFFEEIDSKIVIELLNQNSKLSGLSVKYIRMLLEEFHRVSGSEKGIPRGIGISALLSEVILMRIDKEIRLFPKLISYFRYVDDMLLIFPSLEENENRAVKAKLKELLSAVGLRLHEEDKQQEATFNEGSGNAQVDFLGYSFKVGNGNVDVKLTRDRKSKYSTRIQKSFEAYEKYQRSTKRSTMDEVELASADSFHSWLLVERLRFLSSNTRLSGAKNDALVGVYFSNPLLTSSRHLHFTIGDIRQGLSEYSLDEKTKEAIKLIDFAEGFQKKSFLKYSPRKLKMITKVWLDVQ